MSEIHSLAGRVGGYARAARYDGRLMTEAARRRFIASFLGGHTCRICPAVVIPDSLPDEERVRRGVALHKAHYARMALVSARVRKLRRRAA